MFGRMDSTVAQKPDRLRQMFDEMDARPDTEFHSLFEQMDAKHPDSISSMFEKMDAKSPRVTSRVVEDFESSQEPSAPVSDFKPIDFKASDTISDMSTLQRVAE